ncbi:MAG TPA: hypothetical protein VLA02_09420 [Reyranella sp.]|nr:hypothetical protein [Reyranella sp.]
MLGAMDRRVIRIFLSSPSDVADERRTFVALVAEINDVVMLLDPERNIHLQVQHYESDTYPDIIGSAQEVIDQQMPGNYDVHLGIMWRRAGTPTKDADSGTIHEFNRAHEHRKSTGTPTIMMYFCQEEIPFPSKDDLPQLEKVIGFRESVTTMGLVHTYSKRAAFREQVRLDLLKAVRDILNRQEAMPTTIKTLVAAKVPDQLDKLCTEYDRERTTKYGPDRTRRMTAIVENMRSQAPDARGALTQLKTSPSAGRRLAAIVVLQLFPSRDELDWLAERLDPEAEKMFIGFQAATALLQAVRSLPRSDCSALRAAVNKADDLARRNLDDPPRIRVLEYARQELDTFCPDVN